MTLDCKFYTDHLQFSTPFTYLLDQFCNSCKLTAIQVSSFIRCSLKLLFIYPALCPFDRSLPHLRAHPYLPSPPPHSAPVGSFVCLSCSAKLTGLTATVRQSISLSVEQNNAYLSSCLHFNPGLCLCLCLCSFVSV